MISKKPWVEGTRSANIFEHEVQPKRCKGQDPRAGNAIALSRREASRALKGKARSSDEGSRTKAFEKAFRNPEAYLEDDGRAKEIYAPLGAEASLGGSSESGPSVWNVGINGPRPSA